MIDKFHTIQELKDTGLKMIGAYISDHDIPVGEKYLKPSVISQWDFKNYSEYFTYFDSNGIYLVVDVCYRMDSETTKFEHLKKDLSNIK